MTETAHHFAGAWIAAVLDERFEEAWRRIDITLAGVLVRDDFDSVPQVHDYFDTSDRELLAWQVATARPGDRAWLVVVGLLEGERRRLAQALGDGSGWVWGDGPVSVSAEGLSAELVTLVQVAGAKAGEAVLPCLRLAVRRDRDDGGWRLAGLQWGTAYTVVSTVP